LRQGFVHCWYCGGGSDQKEGQEIHGGWFFFPWHRAFLYFHERILAKLIGDDTFALPYWDWDSQDRQTFPSIYSIPKDPSDCLFDVFRSAMSGSNIPNVVVGPTIMNKTMNAPNNKLFMGWQSGNTGQSGAMENQPHGPVHIWTGDTTLQAANTDMGVLATAAQDPVFFAHHANIDRLWDVWLGLSSQHENYTSPTWLTNTWQFYDENGVWTEIAVSDVVDHTKSLRYEYQPPSKKPIWARRQLVSGATALAFHPAPELLMANAPSGIELGETPLTHSVALPAQTAKTFAALTASSPPAYSLHIEGIQVSSDHQALFEVYLNSPNANAKTGVDVPNFVGTVTVLAMRHNGVSHDHGSVNVAFDITETLARTVKNRSELSVTLVPFAADGNPPKNHAVSFKRIYIQSLQ
jgi:polyphenol oxidase